MPNERTPLLRDVEQTLQTYKPDLLHAAKIIGALQAGKLPSQSQVDAALDALTSKSSVLSPDRRRGEGKLSDGAKTLLDDVRNVLKAVKVWLDAKNEGDVLQELVWNAKRASADIDLDVDGGEHKMQASIQSGGA